MGVTISAIAGSLGAQPCPAAGRPPHRVLRDPQLPPDRLDPKALRPVQTPDLSPLIQSNH